MPKTISITCRVLEHGEFSTTYTVRGVELDDGRLLTFGTGTDGRDSLWRNVDSFEPCGLDTVETIEHGRPCAAPETNTLREADDDNVVYGSGSLLVEGE